MTRERACVLIGNWRIVEADLWDRDYLDLVEPAYLTIEDHGHGRFAFGCVQGSLDCEYSSHTVFFAWQGYEEMDEVWGDGSAELEDDGCPRHRTALPPWRPGDPESTKTLSFSAPC